MLSLVCASAGAEVFRQVGPDGSVTYSDTPTQGAERLDLPPAQTITLPPVRSRVTATQRPTGSGAQPGKSVLSYDRLDIAAPSQGQSVRANNGEVSVSLAMQPALVPGHTIELSVSGEDGQNVYTGTGTRFDLTELSRGEHTVVARIRNGRGEQVMESPAISFFVLRVAAGR